MLYKFLRPFLFAKDPETIHERIGALGEYLGRSWVKRLIEPWYRFEHPLLHTTVFGIDFPNPVGLAAGFDKKGRLFHFLDSLGFGFSECGTVTPLPQEGNARPRLFHLFQDKALINRFGFNNEGVEELRTKLQKRPKNFIVGVNIGKNKNTPNEKAGEDYRVCFEAVADLTDYAVVNVSSPNTPHLRELQEKESLLRLLQALQALNLKRAAPTAIFLKIAPDLTFAQLDDVISIVKATHIAGVIATNTTIAREGLKTSPEKLSKIGAGGLSGKPLGRRSTEVIRYIFQKSQGIIPIIGVGGIFSAQDAYEKIRAGASLVQLYTGLVYEGPGLVKKINQGLVRLLKQDGFSSIQEAVGIDSSWH